MSEQVDHVWVVERARKQGDSLIPFLMTSSRREAREQARLFYEHVYKRDGGRCRVVKFVREKYPGCSITRMELI